MVISWNVEKNGVGRIYEGNRSVNPYSEFAYPDSPSSVVVLGVVFVGVVVSVVVATVSVSVGVATGADCL